jgi:FMN-dependent oxidoreductase (nitrilotriacetate monooxygenase family)
MMRLGVFLQAAGHHMAAWRMAEAPPDAGLRFSHFAHCAAIAEAARLDMLFLADFAAVSDADLHSGGRSAFPAHLEPITLLGALASITRRIGLVGTMTTSYNEPFQIARQFAGLDRISDGRAGWNLVTSTFEAEALNFSREVASPHSERYARALECGDVVRRLWDSWDHDALVLDIEAGQFFDPAKVHSVDHKGPHFSVKGPLTIPASRQRRPVLVQAGSSEDGIRLGTRLAEVVFTAQSFNEARDFYGRIKSEAVRHGRSPDDVKVMPGLAFVVAETADDARARFAKLQSLISPEMAMQRLSSISGNYDFSAHDLDGPFPDLDWERTAGQRSRLKSLVNRAHEQGWTIRQAANWIAGTKGHALLVGTARQIADEMEKWFHEGAADGFNLMPLTLPTDLASFARLVIPELRRRKLFREDYEGSTLRENLGLAAPTNFFSAGPRSASAALPGV